MTDIVVALASFVFELVTLLVIGLVRLWRGPSSRGPSFRYLLSQLSGPPRPVEVLKGKALVLSGDMILIDGQSIRLAGIVAPDMEHPQGGRARSVLIWLCKGHIVQAKITGAAPMGEPLLAVCTLPDGRDLAEELVKQGLALANKTEPGGRYRAFETDEARKHLQRHEAEEGGELPPGMLSPK